MDEKWAASDLEVAHTTSLLVAAEAKAADYSEPVAIYIVNGRAYIVLVSQVPANLLTAKPIEVVHPKWSARYFCETCGRHT